MAKVESHDGLVELIRNLQQEDNRDLIVCLTNDLNSELHSLALLSRSDRASPASMIRLLRRFSITLESLPSPTRPEDFARQGGGPMVPQRVPSRERDGLHAVERALNGEGSAEDGYRRNDV